MEYIKYFESFEQDNKFDYTIDDIKEILNLRGVKFDYIKYLDCGGYGNVFEIDSNTILKITTMDNEVYYANKIKDIESKYLIDIKDVFFHSYTHYGYNVKNGFIIMEKLNIDLNNRFNNFIYYLHLNNPLSDRYKFAKPNEVYDFFKDRLKSLEYEDIIEMWNQYVNIRNVLEKYNLPKDDLRARNIGFRNNTPVFFDISNIYTSKNYNYSKIDVIKHYINVY